MRSSISRIPLILGMLVVLSVAPALAQKLPNDRFDAMLMNITEKVVKIETNVEKIDDTVTKMDKITTGEMATLKTNQDWLIWAVRGLAVGLAGLAVYTFREKIFGRNGNGREFAPPKK